MTDWTDYRAQPVMMRNRKVEVIYNDNTRRVLMAGNVVWHNCKQWRLWNPPGRHPDVKETDNERQ